jgi:cytochrome c-type biogenesis protein CcmE
MFGRKFRFAVGSAVVVGAVLFFALSGFQEGKAYYRTLEELDEMGNAAYGKRLRVAGRVSDGTIERHGAELRFQLEQKDRRLAVRYAGDRPVPDTFKDGVDAVVEGYQRDNGIFEADQIQAKCASKYEAEYATDEKDSH